MVELVKDILCMWMVFRKRQVKTDKQRIIEKFGRISFGILHM